MLSDVTRGSPGNDERLEFLFDRRTVQSSGLAGEPVVPAEESDRIGEGALGGSPPGRPTRYRSDVARRRPGIPERDRERISGTGYTTESEGTGFDLAIVEEVVGGNGGEIVVTVSDAGGARFEVLGVETADAGDPSTVSRREAVPVFKPPTAGGGRMADLEGAGDAALLERAMESSIDGMAVLDGEGQYRYVNRAHAELHGYEDSAELVGRSWRCLYDEERIERFEREVLPAFRERGRWRGETVGRRRDGSTFPQELSLARTPEGGIVCVVRDITERKERLETLERYETVLGTIRDAVYTLDPAGEITWVNETAVEEFDIGYTRGELVGAHISTLLDDEDIEKCLGIIRDILAGERDSGRCEITVRTASGGTIPCDLHLTLLPFEDGSFRGTVGVVRDISERKRHEQRLSVLNRVLRHNLRNEMSVVSGAATVLEAELDGTAARRAEMIRESAERMAALGDEARRAQSLLGRDGRDPSPVEVVGVVEVCCEGLRATNPAATVEVDAPGELWALAGDGLDAVVENLVGNAIEHHPEAPTVVVSVETAGPDRVAIRVVDDGPGIPESEVEVLEADVETPLRHGTGLGLWLVSWLVDAYDGELSFEESPSGGTAVTVLLDRAEEPAEES